MPATSDAFAFAFLSEPAEPKVLADIASDITAFKI